MLICIVLWLYMLCIRFVVLLRWLVYLLLYCLSVWLLNVGIGFGFRVMLVVVLMFVGAWWLCWLFCFAFRLLVA